MKRDPALVPVVAALWLALGVFIIYPFIRLLAVTFTAEDGGLSLENLTMVFSNSYDRLALMNSIWLAIAVAVTGTALGFCFAFAVVRIKMPAPVRWFIAAVTVLPLIALHEQHSADAFARPERHTAQPARHTGLQHLRLLGHMDVRVADILPRRIPHHIVGARLHRPEL